MDTSLIIVDDFLTNANELREMALKLEYPERHKDAAYSGRNSLQRVNVPGVEEQVSRILQQRVRATGGTGHGKFRITLAKDKGRADIHMDLSHWSGIFYLSRPEDCAGGTDFFRHIETGSDRGVVLDQEDMTRLGVQSPAEAKKIFDDVLKNDSTDRSKWERIMTVPMKFNRLILFRPWLWHTSGAGFGNSVENGRLVYLLFFEQY